MCLNGAIDDGVSAVVVAQLLYLEAQSTEKPINMYINSPGGWREIERDRAEMVRDRAKPINMYINSPGGWREIERDRAEMVLSIVLLWRPTQASSPPGWRSTTPCSTSSLRSRRCASGRRARP